VNAYLGEMRSGLSLEWRVGFDGDGECSLKTLKDRVGLPPNAVLTFIQTAHSVMGGGRGETRSG
jgi:hypothetical protein